jgi:putative Mg2+ transporter-C (MgtC) family protein
MASVTAELLQGTALPWQVIALRLLGALALCGAIGLEREARARPAGLRTHMLVGLASATYCLLMQEVVARFAGAGDDVRMDPVRIIEAVTGGVAFLAAGMIVFSGGQVKGLTTGASLWLAASVGLAAGLGLWAVAGMVTMLGLVVIRGVWWGERRMGARTDED